MKFTYFLLLCINLIGFTLAKPPSLIYQAAKRIAYLAAHDEMDIKSLYVPQIPYEVALYVHWFLPYFEVNGTTGKTLNLHDLLRAALRKNPHVALDIVHDITAHYPLYKQSDAGTTEALSTDEINARNNEFLYNQLISRSTDQQNALTICIDTIVQLYNSHFTTDTDSYETTSELALKKYCKIAKRLMRYVSGSALLESKIGTYSLLHYLICSLPEEISFALIATLLECGAHVNNNDNEYLETPLHCALKHKKTNLASFLVTFNPDVTLKTITGESFLHYAARCKDLALFKKIEKLGADINKRTNNHQSPLYRAVESENYPLINYLINHPSIVINPKIYRIAAVKNNCALVHELIERNILGLNHKNKQDGLTPLHIAAAHGYTNLTIMLLQHSQCSNARDNEGRTPLHYAACFGHSDIVRQLLTRCLVDARDNNNNTPLHYCIASNKFTIAPLLLEKNANPNAQDDDGKTPLHIFAEGFNPENNDNYPLLDALLKRNASPNIPNNTRQSCMDILWSKSFELFDYVSKKTEIIRAFRQLNINN